MEQAKANMQKEKVRLNQMKKADYLLNLRRKVHEKRIDGSLNNQDYMVRMEEIKRIEQNPDIDWSEKTVVPDISLKASIALSNVNAANKEKAKPHPELQ